MACLRERNIGGEREQDEGVVTWTWWSYEFAGENREATKELKALFEGATIFSAPKPVKLISRILNLIDTKESTIVDFFLDLRQVLKQSCEPTS